MNLHDYIIRSEVVDWEAMLSAWAWLLPESFTVWIVNRLGDIFLVKEDESIWWFDPGAAKMDRVAASRDEFARMCDDPEKFNMWFMPEVIDQLTAVGKQPNESECYGYEIPPGLGGEYDLANIQVTDLSVHYTVLGQIFESLKDIPDGTKVEFQIKKSEPA